MLRPIAALCSVCHGRFDALLDFKWDLVAEAAKDAIVDYQVIVGLVEIAQALFAAKCFIVSIFNSQEWNNLGFKHSL